MERVIITGAAGNLGKAVLHLRYQVFGTATSKKIWHQQALIIPGIFLAAFLIVKLII